ncbi:MAG: LysR family transcriptional regulator [Burkholderiales bacterium]|nr:LysR family transcriptional regulator [Burkholderiales bacterium]
MARPPTFREIEAFSAVMQSGTTTSAAMMLNTTQPSISRRLAELSSATELRLFEHAHGRLRPTAEGRLLYKTVQQHFAALKGVDAVAAIMRKSGTGALRIGCTPTLGIGLLPPVIKRYLGRFPDTHINLQTLGTPQLAEFLRQEAFDLVLTTGTLDVREFRPRVMTRGNVVCVLPVGHRLAGARRVDPERLHGERVMSLSDNEETTLRIRKIFGEASRIEEFAIETNSSITICGLVAAGNGVGIVNPYIASTFAGRLLIKPFAPAVEIAVQMAMPLQTAPSLLTRHFVTVLASHVARL